MNFGRKLGLKVDADGVGFALLRLQRRVAAGQLRALTRDALRDGIYAVDRVARDARGILSGRDTQVGALRLRERDRRRARVVARRNQPDELRVVQLDDARRTNGLVIAQRAIAHPAMGAYCTSNL